MASSFPHTTGNAFAGRYSDRVTPAAYQLIYKENSNDA